MVTKVGRYQHKRTATAGKVPVTGDLLVGEIVLNTTDRKLYSKDASGNVFQFIQGHKTLKDYGAPLNGTGDDTAALAAAYAATPAWGSLIIPPGGLNVSAFPASGNTSDTVKLWQYEGTKFGTSGSPVNGASGGDTYETFAVGSKIFGRSNSYPNAGAIVRVDGNFNHTGGAAGTISTLSINTDVAAVNPGNFIWGAKFEMNCSAYGGAEHVGLSTTVRRPANALADGNGQRAILFGLYVETSDSVAASAGFAGPLVAFELDLFAHGSDPRVSRQVLNMNIGRPGGVGDACRVGYGINMGSVQNDCFYGTAIKVDTNFDTSGIDFSTSQALNADAAHIRLPAGGRLAWEGTGFVDTLYNAGLVQTRFNKVSKFAVYDDPQNAVQMWVGGAMRSVQRKQFSTLNSGDFVLIAT